MKVLELIDVGKRYVGHGAAVNGISMAIEAGEFTALAGPSGSGKTTLLNLSAGLDLATEGIVRLLGHDLGALEKTDLAALRRDHVGFVFQSFNLFPVLTALENVEYPLALRKVPQKERRARAHGALEEVGLGELARRFPRELSGGQQQRVAIARAMVTDPEIVFADEPTANLDSTTAERLLLLFRRLNERRQTTFVFSSHDPMILRTARRIVTLQDGRIHHDSAERSADVAAVGVPPARRDADLRPGV